MCNLSEGAVEYGIRIGEARGEARGIEIGEARGIKIGEARGIIRGFAEVFHSMLSCGMSFEEVVKITKISPDMVEKVRQYLNENKKNDENK